MGAWRLARKEIGGASGPTVGGDPGTRRGGEGMAYRRPKPANASVAELLIDASPDALLVLSLAGRIRSWNRAAVALFGYTADEAIGHSLDELIVPEERRSEALEALDRVVQTGATLLETVRRRKDGSLIQVDCSMRLVRAPNIEPFISVSEKDATQLKHLRDQQ